MSAYEDLIGNELSQQIAHLSKLCEGYNDDSGASLATIADIVPILVKINSEIEMLRKNLVSLTDFSFQRLGGPTSEEIACQE